MFKTRLDTFGNDFGHFWNFESFLIFLKIFDNSTLQGTLGKKTFSKKSPQNKFKTRLDNFGNDCGHFWNFESFFNFFENFRQLDPPWNTGQKTFEKFTPKHVQNTFGHLWERFWVCLEFWKTFDTSENFRRLDPPWNIGQKIFRKNYPKTCSKHVWTFLGTILGFSAILKSF